MHSWAVAKLKPKAHDTASARQILQGFLTLILALDFTPASVWSKAFSHPDELPRRQKDFKCAGTSLAFVSFWARMNEFHEF